MSWQFSKDVCIMMVLNMGILLIRLAAAFGISRQEQVIIALLSFKTPNFLLHRKKLGHHSQRKQFFQGQGKVGEFFYYNIIHVFTNT